MRHTAISYDLRDLQSQLNTDAVAVIARAEARYAEQIGAAADAIVANTRGCQIVWMCGPSSVGKTTTANRLCAAVEARGVAAFVVSLDDFYRGRGIAPLREDGTFDYESPLALDLPRLHRCLRELMQTGDTDLPRYDFEAGTPSELTTHLHITGRAVVIFEGIQAFSPLLTDGMDTAVLGKPLRLFINTRARFADNGNMLLCRRDIRLMRRLLRDERTRGTDFVRTMAMWQTVLAGDERNIFPYSDSAELVIDTAMSYEPCVMTAILRERLTTLNGTPYEATAVRLASTLARFPALEAAFVPTDSVLREFIGR